MPELSVLVLFAAIFIVSLKGFRDQSFFRRYLFDVNDVKYRREYYRLITCGFLHTDWLHLLFNMITMYFFFGVPFAVLGEMRFFLLYFAGLAFSSLFSYAVNYRKPNYAAVGASGAVTAVLFSAIMLEPGLKLMIIPIPLPIPGYVFAVAYLLYTNYGMRNSMGNIGHSAHLGGATSGILLTIIMYPSVLVYSPWVTTGLAVLVLALMGLELYRQGRGSWGQR